MSCTQLSDVRSDKSDNQTGIKSIEIEVSHGLFLYIEKRCNSMCVDLYSYHNKDNKELLVQWSSYIANEIVNVWISEDLFSAYLNTGNSAFYMPKSYAVVVAEQLGLHYSMSTEGR